MFTGVHCSLHTTSRVIVVPLKQTLSSLRFPTAKLAYSAEYRQFPGDQHLPVILDETYDSPETAVLRYEGGYEGGLLARADSPVGLASMAAYGKTQPPQMHGQFSIFPIPFSV